ncbi:MAG: serine hydrolase [Bdellovibrionales bacterium]
MKFSLLFLTVLFFISTGCDVQHGKAHDSSNNEAETPENDQGGLEIDPPEDSEPVPEPNPEEPNPNQNPSNTTAFLTLPNGKKLSSVKVKGSSLRIITGTGNSFSSSRMKEYLELKEDSQRDPSHKVQWTFMNLDTHEVLERSRSAHKKIFGASSSKIYVAATLLDREDGEISNPQLQQMADMIVVSSNTAWTSMQRAIGDGSSDKGRERIHNFTRDMGYPLTRGYQGYWGKIHGNELVPDEAAETLYDIYHNNFAGAEILWKLMYTSRTGTNRGKKYIPKDIYVGGKTGSYSGPTENPETGEQYTVSVRNHLMVFNINGTQYGLAVLANSGTDQSAALLAGGLIREYTEL